MRVFLLMFAVVALLISTVGCSEDPIPATNVRVDTVFVYTKKPVIDTTNLGENHWVMTEADTFYVMKQYFMAFLDAVKNRPELDSTASANIQKAHLSHLDSLANLGIIDIVGPFLDDQSTRGIAIYNCATLEEAQAHANADPAVKNGRLTIRVRPWMAARGGKLK